MEDLVLPSFLHSARAGRLRAEWEEEVAAALDDLVAQDKWLAAAEPAWCPPMGPVQRTSFLRLASPSLWLWSALLLLG